MIDQLAAPRRLALLLLSGMLLFPAKAGADDPTAVSAQLLAQNTTVRPGAPFFVAVHFRIDPGWHIYWKNPGDTGLPTSVTWDLPEGFAASDLLWPVPQKFLSEGLVSYGYEGEVTLLARLDPPSELRPGPVTIRARAGWLACRIECTPGKADLSLSLPAGSAAPVADGRWGALFHEAASLVPAAAGSRSVISRVDRNRLSLRVSGLTVSPGSTVYFAPSSPGVLAEGAPQAVHTVASLVSMELGLAQGADTRRLQGVLVVREATRARGVEIDTHPTHNGGPQSVVGTAFLVALALAFIGGLILNLMPCVLPVVSLKILSFVRNSNEGGRGALRHGMLFGLGVLVSFWAIAGLLIALRAGGQLAGWGFQFQSPAVVAVTAMLFFLIALNLLDVFQLRFPVRLSAARAGGGAGSFLNGLLAAAVATPCTAPFMGGALGYALTQPPAAGLSVFTALALGMAAPYVALSALPRLVSRIPRPGPWMTTLRQILAFPMLGAVVWMLYVLETQAGLSALTTLLSALVAAGFGAWVFGRWGGLEKSNRSRAISASLAFVLICGATALAAARAEGAGTPDVGPAPASWESWSPERVAQLQAQGTPVFVDFTARWCLTCQVNERIVLRSPAVAKAFQLSGVAALRADWSDHSDAIAQALAGLGRAGVPVYALYPGGAASPVLLPELLTPGIVLEALQNIRSPAR